MPPPPLFPSTHTSSAAENSAGRQGRRRGNNVSSSTSIPLDRNAVRGSMQQRAVRLRKRKQEERLATRRGVVGFKGQQQHQNNNSNTNIATTSDTTPLRTALSQILTLSPQDTSVLSNLRHAITITENVAARSIWQEMLSTPATNNTNNDATVAHQFLHILVSFLSSSSSSSSPDNIIRANDDALHVLVMISASTLEEDEDDAATTTTTSSMVDNDANDDYYGPASSTTTTATTVATTTWNEVFLSVAQQLLAAAAKNAWQNPLYSTLFGNLVAQPCQHAAWIDIVLLSGSTGAAASAGTTTTTTTTTTRWPALVHALPHTAHLCAAILYYDMHRLGQYFIQGGGVGGLTTTHLVQLLSFTTTATGGSDMDESTTIQAEAAWMVEGLAKREAETVQWLVQDPILMDCIFQCLQPSSSTTTTTAKATRPSVQYPLWRAVGHVAVTNQGMFVPQLLLSLPSEHQQQHQPSLLITAGTQLLQQTVATGSSSSSSRTTNKMSTPVVLEALLTMSCLLWDAGTPSHPSTDFALLAWGPGLIQLVTSSGAVVRPIQSQALRTLCVAWTTGHTSGSRTSSSTSTEMLPQWPTPEILNRSLMCDSQYYPAASSSLLDSFLQALLDILSSRHFDTDAHLAALTLLDIVLRHAVAARQTWKNLPNSIECLEHFLLSSNSNTANLNIASSSMMMIDAVADRAADLLDDYFADGEEHEDDDDEIMLTDHPGGDNWMASHIIPSTTPTPSPPMGRGRSRVMPAWMTKQQQQQQQQQHP